MIRNFDTVFKQLDGETLKEASGEVFTLKKAATNALLTEFPGENPSGEDKVKRYQLALRVQDGGEVEISEDEAVLLRGAIAKTYGALIVGQAYEILKAQ